MNLFFLVTRFIILSKAIAFPDWTDCPAVCSCKWTSGKKSALCPSANLTLNNLLLDPDMQVLDLSGNTISSLQSQIFKNLGLLNLQRVFLREAKISRIDREAFREMRILVEVDLSLNLLTSIEKGTFDGNERLMAIILNDNPIKELCSYQFPVLNHLRTLELRNCNLSRIDHLAFQNVKNIEKLNLEGNKLQHIDARTFNELKNMKTLKIAGNPWHCDCHLRSLRKSLIDGKLRYLYTSQQLCYGPEKVKHKAWQEVTLENFACSPEVKVYPKNPKIEVHKNFSLSCRAKGDPEPEISWSLNGSTLNDSVHNSATHTKSLTTNLSKETINSTLIIWKNFTIYNITESDFGAYTCQVRNIGGIVNETVIITLMRTISAPTLSKSSKWVFPTALPFSGIGFFCLLVLIATYTFCRRNMPKKHRMDEVVLQSRSKKPSELSTGSETSASLQSSILPIALSKMEHVKSAEIEPPYRVTIEHLKTDLNSYRTSQELVLPCISLLSPPPTPDDKTAFTSMGGLNNEADLRFPDLLDLPAHSNLCDEGVDLRNISVKNTSQKKGVFSNDLISPYDNMGPRITESGRTAMNIFELPLNIPPPPEFVSL